MPREPIYRPTWWEKPFPWLLDALARLDPEPLAKGLAPAVAPLRTFFEAVTEPLAEALDWVERPLTALRGRAARAVGSAVGALPLPGLVRDGLWLRPVAVRELGANDAQEVFRRQYDVVLPSALIVAVLLHMCAFVLWPEMQAEDITRTVAGLEAVEIPPEVEIPPPPEQIARPAVPVIGSVDIADDITIAPTTFDEYRPLDLPPPPEEEAKELSAEPAFTPMTVRPRVLNRDEVTELVREWYPKLLRDAGIGGEVVIWLFLDAEGRVQDTRIAQSSGHVQLDEAGLLVADSIRFSPALNRDTRVPVWVQQRLIFHIR